MNPGTLELEASRRRASWTRACLRTEKKSDDRDVFGHRSFFDGFGKTCWVIGVVIFIVLAKLDSWNCQDGLHTNYFSHGWSFCHRFVGKVPVGCQWCKLMPPRSRFSRQSSVGCPQGLVDWSTDVDILEKNLWCPWWNGFFARFLIGKCWAKMNVDMGYPQQGSVFSGVFFSTCWNDQVSAKPSKPPPGGNSGEHRQQSASQLHQGQPSRFQVQPLTRCIIACGFIIK